MNGTMKNEEDAMNDVCSGEKIFATAIMWTKKLYFCHRK